MKDLETNSAYTESADKMFGILACETVSLLTSLVGQNCDINQE
jgi:hypothetical protein